MGTYTANYNLFMPTVGEQGWGDLVNGNFSAIDITMKSLSNSIGILETETDAMKEKVDAIELNNDGTVNVGSATQLNKIVTVGVSDIKITSSNPVRGFIMTIGQYIPGVLYTGNVRIRTGSDGNSAPYKLYVYSDSNVWTQTNMYSTTEKDYTFTNAKIVLVQYSASYGDNYYTYLPTYS